MSWISGRTRSKGAMAVNGSAASGRFVGAELVIDPIGTVFEPLEHSPAPFQSHLTSGECIGDFVRRCQMDATRRAILGAAALGAGGFAMMQAAAAAGAIDHGSSGEGGFGRSAVQLPPGAKLAHHDPKDIEAMPDFKYSLDVGAPKITSGGLSK